MDLVDGLRGWSSFENLFRITPVPLMEQDYTEAQAWMNDLKSQGIEDIREAIGPSLAGVRGVVPMIRIVAANPAAILAVGLPPEELLGPIDPRIVNEGSVEGWLEQLDAVWHSKPIAHSMIVAATASGQQYDAETILAAPVITGVPDFSRAVFTIFDVSDHRNEERRMIGLMEAKNRFLASVSHEIRTPLTAVLGFARLLDDGHDMLEDDDRKLMISSIAQHSQEVAHLVDDLLVAARVEIGRIDVARASVDLRKQVDQVLDGGMVAIDVGVRMEQTCMATGDPTRVRQIIRNLLTNAERYGGSNVLIEGRVEAKSTLLEISDDGAGLPVPDWERIFAPYERAHRSPGQPGSVGIGLAVSRQLAELMHGTLVYRFENGRSVFRLTLPNA